MIIILLYYVIFLYFFINNINVSFDTNIYAIKITQIGICHENNNNNITEGTFF